MVHSTACLSSVLCLASIAFATPLDPTAVGANSRRQSNDFVVVTGAITGGVQPRREIRTLREQPEAWNIFILALRRFMDTNQDDKTSYFQIGGIHGAPYVAWDGVESTGNRFSGYCPHSSNLFGTWHKPYLALFEQILSTHANDIAQEFPTGDLRDRYTREAGALRLPYWDWAMRPDPGQHVYSHLFSDETIQVHFPNDTQGLIRNPLLQYDFHPAGDFGGPLNRWQRTVRAPFNVSDANSPSNHGHMESEFDSQLTRYTRSTLYQVLTKYQSFNQFSNMGSEASIFGSLEGIHNNVHFWFGGGHMQWQHISAFDPIFYLHHASVDRIMHIWQKLWPEAYVTPHPQQDSTFMCSSGDVWNAQTPLWPFHSSKSGVFHTSDAVRQIGSFQYTYPELLGDPSHGTLMATISNLYEDRPSRVGMSSAEQAGENSRTWSALIQIRLNPGGPFSVYIFLGDATSDADFWSSDPSYVGSQAFLRRSREGDDLISTGSILLTSAIKDRYAEGLLPDMEQQSIVEYLKTNMVWRVARDGKKVPMDEIPVLNITIKSFDLNLTSSAHEVSHHSTDYIDHFEVTEGRPGAASAS